VIVGRTGAGVIVGRAAAGGVVVFGAEQVIAQPLQRGPVGGRERLAIVQPGQRRQRRQLDGGRRLAVAWLAAMWVAVGPGRVGLDAGDGFLLPACR
jgi:hypothetical protein